MSKFEKFYEGVCRRVIPLMLIGLIFVVVEIINIFSGKALRTIILYDDEKEQPYIVEFKKHNSNPFVRFFFCTDRTKYEIHIPPESIRYDYGVDLK